MSFSLTGFAQETLVGIDKENLKLKMEAKNIIDNSKPFDVNNIPEGVAPIHLNNQNELEEYYVNILKDSKKSTHVSNIDLASFNLSNTKNMLTSSTTESRWGYKNASYTARYNLGFCKLNLTTDYIYGLHLRGRKELVSTSAYCYMSGFTFGNSLGNYSCGSTILDKDTFPTYCSGSINHYIIIEGIGTIGSTPFNYSYTYNI